MIFMQRPNFQWTKFLGAQISCGPNFSGPKSFGAQISRGPNFSGSKLLGAQISQGSKNSGDQMRSGTISVITLLFLLYMSNFGQPNILSIPFTNIGFQLNHFNFVCRFTKEVIQVKKVGFVMNVVMFLAGNKLWIFTNPNTVAITILFVHIVTVVLTAKQFCTSTV